MSIKYQIKIKSILTLFVVMLCSLCVIACSKENEEPSVMKTFEATPTEKVDEYYDQHKEVTTNTYYEMSDGTWKTDEYTYQYKLELTGKIPNAAADTTYIILSNKKDITFEEAWKASGLSSNSGDYYEEEAAVLVGRK